MKMNHYAPTLAGAACLALLPLTTTAQDEFDPAKMAEVIEKYGSPGPEHKLLRSWTGTWKTESTYWIMPGAGPIASIPPHRPQKRSRMITHRS